MKPTPENLKQAEEIMVKALGRVSEQAMGKWLWSNLNKSIAQAFADREADIRKEEQEKLEKAVREAIPSIVRDLTKVPTCGLTKSRAKEILYKALAPVKPE